MAEALAYFKIAGASATIAKGLWDIGAALKDAGTQVRQLATSVECTSSVLMQLGQVLDADGAGVHIDDKRLAARHLEQCSHLMDKLQTVLDKLRRLIDEKGKIHLWSRIRFVFDRSGLAQKWQTLESLKSSLTLLVSVMNLRSAAKKDSSSEITILLQRLLEQGVEDYAARAPQPRQLLLGPDAGALLEADDEDEGSRLNWMSDNLRRLSFGTGSHASDRDTDAISVSETIDLTGDDDITSVVRRDLNLSGNTRQAHEAELFDYDERIEYQRVWAVVLALHQETGVLARDVLRMAQNGSLVPGPKIAWICTNTAGYRAANALLDQKTQRRARRRGGSLAYMNGSIGSTLVTVIYFPLVLGPEGKETGQTMGSETGEDSDNFLRQRLAGIELVVMISEVIHEWELQGFRAGDVIIGRDLIVDQAVATFPYSTELLLPMPIDEGISEIMLQLSLGEMDDSAAQAKLKSVGPGIFERRTAGINKSETVGSVRLHSWPLALTDHHDKEGLPGVFLSQDHLAISEDLAALTSGLPILVVCGVPPRRTRAIGAAANERDEFAIGQAAIAARLLVTLLWG